MSYVSQLVTCLRILTRLKQESQDEIRDMERSHSLHSKTVSRYSGVGDGDPFNSDYGRGTEAVAKRTRTHDDAHVLSTVRSDYCPLEVEGWEHVMKRRRGGRNEGTDTLTSSSKDPPCSTSSPSTRAKGPQRDSSSAWSGANVNWDSLGEDGEDKMVDMSGSGVEISDFCKGEVWSDLIMDIRTVPLTYFTASTNCIKGGHLDLSQTRDSCEWQSDSVGHNPPDRSIVGNELCVNPAGGGADVLGEFLNGRYCNGSSLSSTIGELCDEWEKQDANLSRRVRASEFYDEWDLYSVGELLTGVSEFSRGSFR